MKEGRFYHTYAEDWEKKVYSGVHKCIAVNEKNAVLVSLMHTNEHDPRPFLVDRSAWYHYKELGDETESR